MAAGDDEFIVVAESYSSYTILMGIIDLPKLLIVIHSEGSNLAIGPSRKDDFICEK
jgi:hypothetical protein